RSASATSIASKGWSPRRTRRRSSFLLAAFAEIVRAVFKAVAGRLLRGGLLVEEFLLRLLDRGQFFRRAVAQRNVFARNKAHLADGDIVRAVDPLPRLQDVPEFAFMSVPIRLDPDDHHGRNRPLDHVE